MTERNSWRAGSQANPLGTECVVLWGQWCATECRKQQGILCRGIPPRVSSAKRRHRDEGGGSADHRYWRNECRQRSHRVALRTCRSVCQYARPQQRRGAIGVHLGRSPSRLSSPTLGRGPALLRPTISMNRPRTASAKPARSDTSALIASPPIWAVEDVSRRASSRLSPIPSAGPVVAALFEAKICLISPFSCPSC
jgi:hypothetical protein